MVYLLLLIFDASCDNGTVLFVLLPVGDDLFSGLNDAPVIIVMYQ